MVAVDAGVDHLFRHGGVTPEDVRDLVYGALFTRGPADLHRTAIFVGGSDVSAGEAVLKAVKKTFFGPLPGLGPVRRQRLQHDRGRRRAGRARGRPAGSLAGRPRVAVLAATGPVGQRVARLLGRLGAIGRRRLARAWTGPGAIAESLRRRRPADGSPRSPPPTPTSLRAGARRRVGRRRRRRGRASRSCPTRVWQGTSRPRRSLIDLNAVPPLGIEGVEADRQGADRDGVRAWGALGVGGTKMKIHKKAHPGALHGQRQGPRRRGSPRPSAALD